MRKLMLTCLAALALVIVATSVAQAKERWIRVWVTEINPTISACAVGKRPDQYGACVKQAFDAGKATPTACTEVRVSGTLSATIRLNRGVGYVKLTNAEIDRIDRARQPMIELSVTGVSRLYFLPTPPPGRNCCYDRLVSLPQNRSMKIENDLHWLVRHPDYKRWKGFAIIVPPGAC